MARYTRKNYGQRKQKGTNWFLVILTMLIAAVAVAFIFGYGPFKRDSGIIVKDDPVVVIDEPPAESRHVISLNPDPVPEPPDTIPIPPPNLPPMPKPPLPPELPEPNMPVHEENKVGESNAQVNELIEKAEEALQAKPARIIEARDLLNDALMKPMKLETRKQIKQTMAELSKQWLFSKKIFPEDSLCGTYKVASGDLLAKIAPKYKVPWEIIARINNVTPRTLQVGKTIKVINGPFNVKVSRSAFNLDLYLKTTYVRSFKIGLGMEGRDTPTGQWVVQPSKKLIKPEWPDRETGKVFYPDDPEYPLGSRYIGIEGISGDAKGRIGFAIHGTKDADSIGKKSSRGCIRLYNGDVILMYEMLEEGVSQVEIVE